MEILPRFFILIWKRKQQAKVGLEITFIRIYLLCKLVKIFETARKTFEHVSNLFLAFALFTLNK